MKILLDVFFVTFLLVGLIMPIWGLLLTEKFGNLKAEIESKRNRVLNVYYTRQEIFLGAVNVIASLLVLIGLFTNQWILFSSMILFSIINGVCFKGSHLENNIIIRKFRSLVYVILIIFIGLNHFYLKIDLLKWVCLNN
jgi:hypothetical protein